MGNSCAKDLRPLSIDKVRTRAASDLNFEIVLMQTRKIFFFVLFFLAVLLISCKSGNRSTDRVSKGSRIERGASISAGTQAPEIHLKDLQGETRKLSDYRGKTVLINFWATWCAPCVAEMPALERLYQKLKNKGFEVVSVSCDSPDSIEDLRSFVDKKGISFPVLLDPEIETPSHFGVTGFPESFFVDSSGNFLTFRDPSTQETSVRIVADRPWDSKAFIGEIEKMLQTNN